jgi:hypothetical protein
LVIFVHDFNRSGRATFGGIEFCEQSFIYGATAREGDVFSSEKVCTSIDLNAVEKLERYENRMCRRIPTQFDVKAETLVLPETFKVGRRQFVVCCSMAITIGQNPNGVFVSVPSVTYDAVSKLECFDVLVSIGGWDMVK